MSLPARGAWIEIKKMNSMGVDYDTSLPARGAWIEIFPPWCYWGGIFVAPRKGSVD